jgi:asparagine synthase (glutamine-hydrolysing)
MASQDGNFVLIFNGEIYNHLEIREELVKHGYHFKGTSDTETLLHGFIHYGTAILSRLNGIFAFAVYDKAGQKVFIARDHFGVKPLYFVESENGFAFASEMKAFKGLELISSQIDYTALVDYLNFLYSPGVKTPFKNVRKLLPGHFITYDVGSHSRETTGYYDVSFKSKRPVASEKEWTNRLERTLFAAVERQLMSDVPLGFFVSGGVDSSLIAAIASRIKGANSIDAFTIDPGAGLQTEGFSDDLSYAKLVSKKLGFKLNVVESKIDILADFDKMIWHLEEPQADPAPLSVYNICKVARQNDIKVLLEEQVLTISLVGYRRHQALKYQRYIDVFPKSLAGFFKEATGNFNIDSPVKRRLRKLLKMLVSRKAIDLLVISPGFPWRPTRACFLRANCRVLTYIIQTTFLLVC